MKIWAKVLKDEKIILDTIYERAGKFDENEFNSYLSEICFGFDIPTPIIIAVHLDNFLTFNIQKFRPSDFLEAVAFDEFVIENC